MQQCSISRRTQVALEYGLQTGNVGAKHDNLPLLYIKGETRPFETLFLNTAIPLGATAVPVRRYPLNALDSRPTFTRCISSEKYCGAIQTQYPCIKKPSHGKYPERTAMDAGLLSGWEDSAYSHAHSVLTLSALFPKPTIVIVPGASHQAKFYVPLKRHLELRDYSVEIIDNPSTRAFIEPLPAGDDPHEADVKNLRNRLQALLDAGQEVLVVMHSYGGLIGSHAMKGLNGRILALVYIAAFALPRGSNVLEFFGFSEERATNWVQVSSGERLM